MKRYLFPLIILMLGIASCNTPEPRRPVSARSGSFIKESIARNKKLLREEESMIESIIEADSTRSYERSANGYWYSMLISDTTSKYRPKENDLVRITYELRQLDSTLIYNKEDIGQIEFKVDKEAFFPGLRTGVKILREGESAAFYFPSALAYGYHGDDNKIGTNVPLLASVTLLEVIEKASDSIPQNKTPN